MDRRRFLSSTGALGALALTGTPGIAAVGAQPPAPAPSPTGALPAFEFDEATVADLQRLMTEGRHTARSIAEAYVARIRAVDHAGPTLRSVVEINPDALAIADERDAERRAGRVRGPLHGIPVLLKDNVDTGDRMLTTAGSLALVGAPAPRDAGIAERLRAAGAVLLGKTNLSEWANFRSTRSSSGWSARGGQTRNPYVLDRSPCGSSSGSGVAVAANLAALAVGTETDGSIVCPASSNGIVGLKPTLGLVSRSGIIPIAHSQDTAGPMTRTVRDAALLLGALAAGGADARDPLTRAAQRHLRAAGAPGGDYTRVLDADGLRGARIGVLRRAFGFHAGVDALMEDALGAMRAAGAVLVDPVRLATEGQWEAGEFDVLLWEFKADLDAYLAERARQAPASVAARSLAELIAFNRREAAREMPWFGQELLERAQARTPLTDPAYRRALARNRRLTQGAGLDATLAAHRLDAIVAPTGGPAWAIDLVNGDHFTGGYASASAVAGYPHVTVPAGQVHGLPVGLSFFAGAWSEPVLLRLAYAFEQRTRHRAPPRFVPTLGAAPGSAPPGSAAPAGGSEPNGGSAR